jgi:hypothetical protein
MPIGSVLRKLYIIPTIAVTNPRASTFDGTNEFPVIPVLRMTTNLPVSAISVIGSNAATYVSCVPGVELFESPIEVLVIGSTVSARENQPLNLIGCLFTVHIKTDSCIAAFVAAVTSSNIVCLLCDDGTEDLFSRWQGVFHWLDHNSAISHLTFPAHSVKVIIIGHFVCNVHDWVEILLSQLDCVDRGLIISLIQSLVTEHCGIEPFDFLLANSISTSTRLPQ